MSLREIVKKILREEKLPASYSELIKTLPEELKKLFFKQWGAKQNPEWHPEGNSLKHIIVVLKRAYHHYPDDPNMIMTALFHDLGKMDTYNINPKTGNPTAYGHEFKSTDYVEKFRDWIESFEGTDVDEIKFLVQNHMKVKPKTWDSMKDTKKELIINNPAFDKLMSFTNKLDGGGTDLKETIRRILREMIIDESSEKPQEIVKTNINQILIKLKSDASRGTKGVINVKSAIDEFGTYLINRIPEILEKSKTGKNGEQFALECYNKVSEILDNQLKDISDMKRFFIRKLAPSEKDKFIKNSSNPNLYDLYFYFLEQMIDFPYQVGYLPEFDKVSENMAKFSSQITNYIDRNRTKIINNFVNKVANFLYK